jgi:TolA-binding protein
VWNARETSAGASAAPGHARRKELGKAGRLRFNRGVRNSTVGPIFAVALGSVAVQGCVVTQRDHDALAAKTSQVEQELQRTRADLAQARADLEATRQRLDNALRANADSSTDLITSKQRLNELAGRVDEVQHGIEELKKDVAQSRTEIYARMDDLKRAQQPAAPAPPPIAIPQDKGAHFAAIEAAHAKKDWAQLRVLAPEYLNRYPSDDKADDAIFYVGDADLQDGRPTSSLGHMNRVLKMFPRSNVLDRVLYDMGEAYLMLHDCANAKLAYEACEKRFAKEKVGQDARAKLATIAKNPPGLCAPN